MEDNHIFIIVAILAVAITTVYMQWTLGNLQQLVYPQKSQWRYLTPGTEIDYLDGVSYNGVENGSLVFTESWGKLWEYRHETYLIPYEPNMTLRVKDYVFRNVTLEAGGTLKYWDEIP